MIVEKLRFARVVRHRRPVDLRLGLTVATAALLVTTASPALAQITPMTQSPGPSRPERVERATPTPVPTPKKTGTKAEENHPTANENIDLGTSQVPALQVFAAVNLAEVYTSNATGTANGGRSDFFTRPGLNLGLSAKTTNWLVDGRYSLTGEWHARNHRLDRINNHLNLLASGVLVPETLFLDTRAFATPAVLTRAGSLTADESTNSSTNTRNTYGFTVRPALRHNFGTFAQATLMATQSGVYFLRPSVGVPTPLPNAFRPAQNTNSTALTAQLASGPDFGRLAWTLSASATDTWQETDWQKERAATAEFQYAITRDIALIGTGGYSTYEASQALSKGLNGPVAMGGARVSFGPSFVLQLQAGVQNNFPSYIGSMHWQLTPKTVAIASATDRVSTPQQRILGNLAGLGATAGGDFYNSANGYDFGDLPGSPAPYGLGGQGLTPLPGDSLALDNAISRYRSLQASIVHQFERMSFRLSGYGSIQDRLSMQWPGVSPRSSVYGVRFTVLRNLNREWTAEAALAASQAYEFGGHDRIYRASAGLTYQLSPDSSVYLDGTVINRASTGLVAGFENGDMTDGRVTIGIRKAF